ncbi:MAG: DEAD/DEAH box helicase family protein [Lachnospiraceae bacterium]|nr:DEAD/DEAH box helicase family protein [Lachnospiraceae bacterium]
MAKKIFSWENFTYDFIRGIAYSKETPVRLQPKTLYEEGDYEFLIPYVNRICSNPDEYFVRKYRNVIEDYFLNGTNHLVQVVRRLERLNYGGIRLGENEDMLFALRQKKMTQTLCDAYLSEIQMTGKTVYDDEESMFRVPKTLDLIATGHDNVSLYSYQEKAVAAMNQYFIEEDRQSAILSMPTGSGKTRTGVYYLLHDMISRGYQVIWLCHRSMLIEQAAEQFYKFAPLIKEENSEMKQFKMVCVSGKHANVRALEADDNLIVASVQSLCNNTIYLPNILSEKVMIVVDEAHHTLAPSYRRIIKEIRTKRPNAKLLGLTATPVRLTEKATGQLMKLFDNKIVISVRMSYLIEDGTLAKPHYIPYESNVAIDALIERDERK